MSEFRIYSIAKYILSLLGRHLTNWIAQGPDPLDLVDCLILFLGTILDMSDNRHLVLRIAKSAGHHVLYKCSSDDESQLMEPIWPISRVQGISTEIPSLKTQNAQFDLSSTANQPQMKQDQLVLVLVEW